MAQVAEDAKDVNSLVVLPSEISNSGQAMLVGERSHYAFDTHGVRVGQSIKVAVLGGMRGTGFVSHASSDGVVIDLSLTLPPRAPVPVTLLVGVSRPQTVKKVLQSAVMFGVAALHFVRSELGEKSYLQSRALDGDEIQVESIKALEQVWDSRVPEISIHRSFSYVIDRVVPQLGEHYSNRLEKILAHPGGALFGVSDQGRIRGAHTVVAIGPERGWSPGEVSRFREVGFEVRSLGERVVRVEHAIVFTLGALALLREV